MIPMQKDLLLWRFVQSALVICASLMSCWFCGGYGWLWDAKHAIPKPERNTLMEVFMATLYSKIEDKAMVRYAKYIAK